MIVIPSSQRDLNGWTMSQEGDYLCFLVPVTEPDKLRQSGINKVCVRRDLWDSSSFTVEDFEQWMNQRDPDNWHPPTWYVK